MFKWGIFKCLHFLSRYDALAISSQIALYLQFYGYILSSTQELHAKHENKVFHLCSASTVSTQDMARKQKSPFFLPQIQIPLQILLLLAAATAKSPLYGCVTSRHPPHTKSSQLNLACCEITRCSFAVLKYLLAKRYRCSPPRGEWLPGSPSVAFPRRRPDFQLPP